MYPRAARSGRWVSVPRRCSGRQKSKRYTSRTAIVFLQSFACAFSLLFGRKTYDLVLFGLLLMTGCRFGIDQRSMNDAMISVLTSKLNTLNLRRNFLHRRLGDYFEPEGVNQIGDRGSEFDAPSSSWNPTRH